MSSPYIPFHRWFADEGARERDEIERLYAWVAECEALFAETFLSVGKSVYDQMIDLPPEVLRAFTYALYDCIKSEPYFKELPSVDVSRLSLEQQVALRSVLKAKQYFFEHEKMVLKLFHEGVGRCLVGLKDTLPKSATPSPFTIPLAYAFPNLGELIDQIGLILSEPAYAEHRVFQPISTQLHRNLYAVSGSTPKVIKPPKWASENPAPPHELVKQYLSQTPFRPLFESPVPLKLTHEDRFNHMHIVGGTGAGKTSLLENLIRHDLQSLDPPSLVIVDPHRDLIGKLTRADLGIEDRLIIIDPRDIQNPPALNIFALNQDRLQGYDEATREQVTAGVIQTFDYLFSGLIGADLTAKQGVFFRYVARLMLSLPETLGRNATILDMLRLMSDSTPYQPAIDRLPDIPREFFLRDFESKTFQQTKEQIRYRLQAILENPTMARLFTSPDTKVDLFTEMNRGAVILVDTAKDYLKGASANFGRIFISLTLQAVLERAAIPAKDRKDTFLIVDEAATYFDSNIDDLLTEARKYRCGCVFAHQYLDQASASLRASLAANTGTKFASGLSSSDARSMAPDMRTTADFILGQPKLQFAAHIRNVTPHAVSIPVTPGVLDRLPQLSSDDQAILLERNRVRVSLSHHLPATAEPIDVSPPSPGPDEDISPEW